jgi:hypothetical protein
MLHHLSAELSEHNEHIDNYCQSRWGVTVQAYKLTKAITQFSGAAAGIYAMSLGADPLTAFVLIAMILAGPEAFEFIISQQ